MSPPRRAVSAGLLLAASAGCAGAPVVDGEGRREITIDAEGWAPVAGENALTARYRALADAQKKAVEKAVGVTLRASTRVDDAVNVRQSIEANMGGTIRRYDVTSEGAGGGFYKVGIRAVVLYRPVVVRARGLKSTHFSVRIANEKVAGAIRSALAAGDYQLSADDAESDVVVTGVVETHGLSDPRLGGFYSYWARVSLSVSDLRSGKVSALANEASAIDVDEHAARDQALEKAGRDAGASITALFPEASSPGAAAGPQLSSTKLGADLPTE